MRAYGAQARLGGLVGRHRLVVVVVVSACRRAAPATSGRARRRSRLSEAGWNHAGDLPPRVPRPLTAKPSGSRGGPGRFEFGRERGDLFRLCRHRRLCRCQRMPQRRVRRRQAVRRLFERLEAGILAAGRCREFHSVAVDRGRPRRCSELVRPGLKRRLDLDQPCLRDIRSLDLRLEGGLEFSLEIRVLRRGGADRVFAGSLGDRPRGRASESHLARCFRRCCSGTAAAAARRRRVSGESGRCERRHGWSGAGMPRGLGEVVPLLRHCAFAILPGTAGISEIRQSAFTRAASRCCFPLLMGVPGHT